MRKDKDRYWDCLDQAMEASHGGRIEEALAWLDEALRVHPDGAEAHNGRGEILWDDGRIDEALIEFDRATIADGKFTATGGVCAAGDAEVRMTGGTIAIFAWLGITNVDATFHTDGTVTISPYSGTHSSSFRRHGKYSYSSRPLSATC